MKTHRLTHYQTVTTRILVVLLGIGLLWALQMPVLAQDTKMLAKEANKALCIPNAAHFVDDSIVIVDRTRRCNQRIGPAVPDNRLAASIAERAQIWIVGPDDKTELLHRLFEQPFVTIVRQRGPVEIRILL